MGLPTAHPGPWEALLSWGSVPSREALQGHGKGSAQSPQGPHSIGLGCSPQV